MSAAMALPRPEPVSSHFASVSSASQNNKTLPEIADVHIRTPSPEATTVARVGFNSNFNLFMWFCASAVMCRITFYTGQVLQ